jgi:hypothetical protein
MMRACVKETMTSILEETKDTDGSTGDAAHGETMKAANAAVQTPREGTDRQQPTMGTQTVPSVPATAWQPPTSATPPTTVAVTFPEVKNEDAATMDMGITDARSLAPRMVNQGQMSMPFTTISKFDGEYWPDFIEYFESVADANSWNEKEKLTYLLMSIEGRARVYARGEKGVPQTFENVKKRLERRYGQHEPAFQVRQQLSKKPRPGIRSSKCRMDATCTSDCRRWSLGRP